MLHGYRMIWTPHVELFHFESLSRDPDVSDEEVQLIEDRWCSILNADDPYLPDFESSLANVE
jgi:hypothetical protein